MDEVARIAREHRPKLLLAGWSAYPRQLDFARFREIADEVGALLMVDMAHFAGLVAAGLAPEPRRVRRGRRHDDHPQDARRPARRGDPLPGALRQGDRLGRVPRPAGRPARARDRRQGVSLADRCERGLPRAPAADDRRDAQALASRCSEAGNGVNVLTGGTDVHLVLVDLRESECSGQDAEDRLHEIRITVNRNAVPFDPRPPRVTSGLRIGSPALTTRGLGREDFLEIGEIIGVALGPRVRGAPRRAARSRCLDRRALPAVRRARDRDRGLDLGLARRAPRSGTTAGLRNSSAALALLV
jgi:glycine hydroxymethyltransferase